MPQPDIERPSCPKSRATLQAFETPPRRSHGWSSQTVRLVASSNIKDPAKRSRDSLADGVMVNLPMGCYGSQGSSRQELPTLQFPWIFRQSHSLTRKQVLPTQQIPAPGQGLGSQTVPSPKYVWSAQAASVARRQSDSCHDRQQAPRVRS